MILTLSLPVPLHDLNESMRGKPGVFALVKLNPHTGLMVHAVALSATHLSTKGICPSEQPEIRYVGEITANVQD